MSQRRSIRRCARALAALLVLMLPLAAARPAAGEEIRVPAGGDLQAALDAAQPGDTLLLAAGATYVGNFVIRRGVTLQTDGPLPAGRVTPSWSGQLARLQSPSNQPALRAAPAVRGVRIVGIEIAPNGHPEGTSIEIGSVTARVAADQPRDVVLDRVLARGNAATGQKRGLSLHGSDITVTRSYVADMKQSGVDTQAIWINNGPGPYTITDNYLEASGENLLVGGDDPRIDQLVPADILIEGNDLVKPLSWKAEGWTVKNLLQFKNARRVTIRGNVLSGNWVSGQTGYAVLFTPRNQYGRAPWTVIEDVVMEHNIIRESSSGFNVSGDDDEQPSQRTRRIEMRHNLLLLDHRAHGGEGRCVMVGRAPQQVTYANNTCIATGSSSFYTYRGGSVGEVSDGVFRANVFLHHAYGFFGENAAPGIATLTEHYPAGGVLAGNLIGGGSRGEYPGNHVLPVGEFEQQFRHYAEGDYRLTDAAVRRFGDVPGADLDQIDAAIAAARSQPSPGNPSAGGR
jgi:hypothetical protein